MARLRIRKKDGGTRDRNLRGHESGNNLWYNAPRQSKSYQFHEENGFTIKYLDNGTGKRILDLTEAEAVKS